MTRDKCCYSEEKTGVSTGDLVLQAITKLISLSNRAFHCRSFLAYEAATSHALLIDPMLLAPNSTDAEAKQKRDDLSFRTALGEDMALITRLHKTGRETEICGTHSARILRYAQRRPYLSFF